MNTYNLVVGGTDVTAALVGLSWGGSIADLADKALASVAVHPTKPTGIGGAFVNGTTVRVRGNGQDVFYGPDFVVEAAEGPLTAYALEAYDPLIYLAKSEDDLMVASGGTSGDLLEAIGRKWGVPIVASDMPIIYLPAKSFLGETPGAVLQYLMETCALFSGVPYYPRWEGGVAIRALAPGAVAAELRPRNAMQVRARSDIEGLISAVKISGSFPTEDPDAPAPTGGDADQPITPVEVPPVIRGPGYVSQYGKIQKMLKSADFPSEAVANQVADDVLRVFGQPRVVATWVGYDAPGLRKGDSVYSDVGAARGVFVVTAVEHDAATQLMTVTSDSQALMHLRLTGPTDPRGVIGAPPTPDPDAVPGGDRTSPI